MTSAEFRNALAKLRFLELPESIDLTLYRSRHGLDLAR